MIKNKIINEFVNVVEGLNIRFFLVGGAVRDLLIGQNPIDYDFVALLSKEEHKVISKKIASILKCEVKYNDYYNTAKFLYKGLDIDFVMARKETYEGIAQKPSVYEGELIDDLKRRDYTINAIAFDIIENKLIDPFNGQEDLKNKKLIVLHDKSFKDDPTRLFRGVRYASRLDLDIDDKTYKLMEECIEKLYFKYLPSSRIRMELDSILKENNLTNSFSLLQDLKFFNYLINCNLNINFNFYNNLSSLSILDKYVAFFYNNTQEKLNKLKDEIDLGNLFIEKCLKLNQLNGILKNDDYIVYKYLIMSIKGIDNNLITSCFNDKRIINYINNHEKFKLNTNMLKNIEDKNKKKYIIEEKIRFLLDNGG